MDLATIEMPRAEARKAYLEYREAIKEQQGKELDEVHRRQLAQDKAIAAGYRALSVGRQLLRLSESILAGGFDSRGLPRLAVMRADIPTVEVRRWRSGELRYRPYEDSWRVSHRAASKVITFDGPESTMDSFMVEAVADTPLVPPEFRPDGHLRNYHILWEAKWRRPRASTRAPGDPALLKRLTGDLWAVLAVWDLTDVEKAALESGTV